MKIKMSEEELLLLEEFIEDNKLKIEIISVVKDESLYKLGFSAYIPCIVEINATEKAIEEASEIANDYEINAFDTSNSKHPSSDNEEYNLYKKYGWIWDLFNSDHWEYIE